MNLHWLIGLMMAILCALILAQSIGCAQELRRIHYGTSVSISHLPVWVAKDAGLFAKKGLNVEPVQIRGGALITMGIMSGNSSFLARERSRWLLRALKGATSFCSPVPPTWK